MESADRRLSLRLLLICWAIIVAAFVARSISGAAITPLILDTDDAMRLTIVHDFLNGQSWYDLVQHRLNVPYGAEIHWSRLIDLPEAALILLLRPWGSLADVAAAYAWPLALLLALLALNGKIALRLAGREAALPALLLPAFSLITMAEFAPGRFDHHGVQILLGFAMLLATLAALERHRFALFAGVAAAGAIAVGIEGLPMVGATAVAFGLAWVADAKHATALRDFGLSFALTALLALAIGVPPERWLVAAYDQISIVYVAAALLCGGVFLVLSVLTLRAWPLRLVAGAAGGVLVLAIIVLAWRGLMGGPYGTLDPWLVANWIDRISEAQPWWVSLVGDPTYPLAVMVPVLVALIVVAWNVVRGDPAKRATWLIYGLFLVIALAVMLLQIRAARMATPLAVPACAALIAAARQRYLSRKSITSVAGLIGSWCISAGIVVAVLVNLTLLAFPDYADATEDKTREARLACLMPKAFTSLAAQPPERIMAPIDLGAHLLLWTPHSVVAAPYHRNAQGVRDAFRFFNDPLEQAREILEERGIGLVVICPAMPEVRGMVDYAPDSFVALYAEGKLPAWLHDVSLAGEPLKVFTVQPR